MSKPVIALYLGESYATIGLFNISQEKTTNALFEKSFFLPQVSLKNLLNQTKSSLMEHFPNYDGDLSVYIVTRYFDRLKQFRLGGSISQVILKGFENSYTLDNSNSLSLAASQLIIALDSSKVDETHLEQELARVKKINPDLNKVVIAIPEGHLKAEKIDLLNSFYSEKDLKVFNCRNAADQNSLRRTLLNAGSEGTKEEIIDELKETFGENTEIKFYCKDSFQRDFENCELFGSATNFLANYIDHNKCDHGAYFDIETSKVINRQNKSVWNSPWGAIPVEHYNYADLSTHPYSEVKLNHLAILHTDSNIQQLEPGPVVAGRAIKPLMIDLFYEELLKNDFTKKLFTQLGQDTLKQKITNLFTVLEKGQKNSSLTISINELKSVIKNTIHNEISYFSSSDKRIVFGPLADVFASEKINKKFSWPKEILDMATREQS